ncbi:hypothetical protein [Legionella pneumophila]|uniref:Uncharacterized protein n=1 Tax=Legionella pneumophila subsp. pascullei TaxID=91890 RepID=A0AAX2IYV1_LEGPN|nr:hypothetical protein [Legionella pneumophila]AMP89180.1 hypothetical protein AXF35_05570 [Legionella pneumophila subsp. pascullei]AMP93153.1 hypothetical protein AXF36_11225 [Legionella pneumophila subsp. pascullei]AMP96119.1 hypothetical protein AXF37_11115 [Legionella pneumophila subsp. pascullei]SQG91065.1 Uncharacterised protein [Legionella pneumophila subsp. pascullei]VEH07610.1 Uncharacterised protein [Legionella pneumophila subsp. pascullei]
MNYFIGLCLGLLGSVICYAEPYSSSLPEGLIKVNKENNPKCVEFVTYKEELYCSIVPLADSSVDSQVINYEKQMVRFDDRPWKIAWGKKTDKVVTVEYIPVGDDINNWKELITTQFMPGLTNMTPAQFGNEFLYNLDKSGVKYTVNVIEEKPDLLIFEFKVQEPANLQQDEILKITKGKDGIYVLHYAIKESDMTKENRDKWVKNLKNSFIKASTP